MTLHYMLQPIYESRFQPESSTCPCDRDVVLGVAFAEMSLCYVVFSCLVVTDFGSLAAWVLLYWTLEKGLLGSMPNFRYGNDIG